MTIPLRNLIGRKYFEPNIRHDYETATYDITLAMATTDDTNRWLKFERELAGQGQSRELNTLENKEIFKNEVVILAQSASTIAQVTSLNIESFTSPNQRQSISYSTKMRMNVVQPLGNTFLRNIYKAATLLDIKNHYSHPYFLQVYLKGRKADGTAEQEIPGTRRCYAIYITNITYRVELGGSTYDVQAIRTGNMGLVDDHNLVADLEMQNIKTFDEFLKQLEKELASQERHFLGQSKLILDRYKFRVAGPPIEGGNPTNKFDKTNSDQFLNAPIIFDGEEENSLGQNIADGGVKAEVEKNTAITEILEKFINRNEWIYKHSKNVREELSKSFAEGAVAKDDRESFKNLLIDKFIPTVSTNSTIIKYDPLRRDYAREFTYTINLVPMTTPSAAIREELQSNPRYTKERIKNIIAKKRMIKRYDYFYTGLNLDVINFDINYNFQYVYGLDTVVGLFNKYGNQFYSKFKTENSSQKKIDSLGAVKMTNTFDDYTKDGVLDGNEKFELAKYRYNILRKTREIYMNSSGVQPDPNTLSAYNQLVEEYNDTLSLYNQGGYDDVGNTLSKVEGIQPEQMKFKNDVTKEYLKLGKGKTTYAEKIEDKRYVEAYSNLGTKMPVQFYERYFKPESEGMIGVGANSDFHTILKNAKVGSNEMVNAVLEIIGDPYWLDGPGMSETFNNREMVNYRQEAVILFSSQVPSAPEEETGYLKTAESRSDEFLTALYRVWKVDHTFENGQFTQRLSMVRDTITDLSIMMDEGDPDVAEEENNIASAKEDVKKATTADDGHKNDPIGNDQPQKKKDLTYNENSAQLKLSKEARGKLPSGDVSGIDSVESNLEEGNKWVDKYQKNTKLNRAKIIRANSFK